MKKSLRLFVVALTLVAALGSGPLVSSQDSWRGKPFQQWTKKAAEELLTDSPWVQTASPSGLAVNFGGLATDMPDKAITVRLRSALPVRQAILRLRQLREKYDELNDAKKAEFDEKNKPLVECPACPDNYVVSILPPPGGRMRLPGTFITTSPEKMRLFVQLTNERGERREVVHYAPPKTQSGEAVFFFPRANEKGEPLLNPSNKRLILTLGREILGSDMLTRFEFDVAKMVIDGKVEF